MEKPNTVHFTSARHVMTATTHDAQNYQTTKLKNLKPQFCNFIWSLTLKLITTVKCLDS